MLWVFRGFKAHNFAVLVHTVMHLTATEPDISLSRWWRPKTKLKGE